ncbi:helix-turn-helix transcriptional regulator [Paraburkholderia metrosideri]|uniref:Helix-turn-helix transcriptional regulator n=1 Tax=Paraburkholderia metrosideri TaxID=580937 RepID=A0ABW9DWB6_9BURK
MSRLTPTPLALGIALKRWRLLHRVKQTHAAEIFSVAQSTVSRWEAGLQEMEPAERVKVERLLAARLESAADRALDRLVTESPREVHLVCDFTHRLLACSSSRAAQFGVPVAALLGRSLWRYATPEIMAKEHLLDDLGWRSVLAPLPLEFGSGVNHSSHVPIHDSRCRWTRMTLSDGTAVRLVETL